MEFKSASVRVDQSTAASGNSTDSEFPLAVGQRQVTRYSHYSPYLFAIFSEMGRVLLKVATTLHFRVKQSFLPTGDRYA